MSRIGKKPIPIPEGVKVSLEKERILVDGSMGSLSRIIPRCINVIKKDNILMINAVDQTRKTRSLHGLTRTLIANMIEGVHKGFTKVLEINGVGYRAEVKGERLKLILGFSHPKELIIPQGIDIKVEKNVITVKGFDKEKLGQFAADIRSCRPVEPYKGKGIRYRGEYVKKKAGKTSVRG